MNMIGLPAVPGADYMAVLKTSDGRYRAPRLTQGARDIARGATTVAVIDTGVLPDHPWIARSLATPPLDVTKRGPIDENGHGTVVSLLVLAAAPNVGLISIRALDRRGRGSPGNLLKAMQLALESGADMLNLSLGRYDPACRGDCAVCSAVVRIAAAGPIVVAAAGNVPGRTDCPAKAGLFAGAAISIAAWDPVAQGIAWYSGVGEFGAPVIRYDWVAAEE